MPILAEPKLRSEEQRRRLSSKSGLAKLLRYSLNRWNILTLYICNGRIGSGVGWKIAILEPTPHASPAT